MLPISASTPPPAASPPPNYSTSTPQQHLALIPLKHLQIAANSQQILTEQVAADFQVQFSAVKSGQTNVKEISSSDVRAN
jgi:hypothetical protein